MVKRSQNIEHQDLTTMIDDRLVKEGKYWYLHSKQLCAELNTALFEVENGHTVLSPVSKTIEDLKFSIQRFQAIKEEINYRAEMMR